MDAKTALGQFIRASRENRFTQQELAAKAGISYQYLSGVESGKENFTIDVLDALARALGFTLPRLIIEASYGPLSSSPPPRVNATYFRPGVPLPPALTTEHLEAAMNETQRLLHYINASLTAIGGQPLGRYIQANNFSGVVSNLLCDSLNNCSPYKHHSGQKYPDLTCTDTSGKTIGGLEVKATTREGKGGESHNGHSGWHLVAHFVVDSTTGGILFQHVMIAELNGHQHSSPDWKRLGSKVNPTTGSQRTETYVTTPSGTGKLRHGSVYLNPGIDYSRWRRPAGGAIPPHSIVHPANVPAKPKRRGKK
jgi:transcriptional regulator with XRE-family HTH domain